VITAVAAEAKRETVGSDSEDSAKMAETEDSVSSITGLKRMEAVTES